MKAYGTSSKAIKKAVDAEWQNKEGEYFEKCKNDIIPQILAVCMMTLKTRFGFGKKRITDFYNDVTGTFEIMEKKAVFGKSFTTVDCINMIKDDYDIDLDKK